MAWTTFAPVDLGFVDLDPPKPLALKLAEVQAHWAAQSRRGYHLPVAAMNVIEVKTDHDGSQSPSTAAPAIGAGEWVGIEDPVAEAKLAEVDRRLNLNVSPVAQPAGETAAPELGSTDDESHNGTQHAATDKRVLAALVAMRSAVTEDLAHCAVKLHPTTWATKIVPRIERYIAFLDALGGGGGGAAGSDNASQHLEERGGSRFLTFFFWHPSDTAINDVHYEKACVLGNVGLCELRAAAVLQRRARGHDIARQGTAAAATKAEEGQPTEADDDRRVAYKFLCSAAHRFDEASSTMRRDVEPLLLHRSSASSSEGSTSLPPKEVHPTLTGQFYAALSYLALAEAQEIGYHRSKAIGEAAQRAELMTDQPSLTRPMPKDGLCAQLAAQVSHLYHECLATVRALPPPDSVAAAKAAASVLHALSKLCGSKCAYFAGVAHAHSARRLMVDEAGVAAAHSQSVAQCVESGARPERALRHSGSSANEGLVRLVSSTGKPTFVLDAVGMIRAYAEAVAHAVQRMNDTVTRAQPTDADRAKAVLPPPRELARKKAYALG